MEKSPLNEELSDADLLRLSANGNEEAFVVLYRRHQGPVFRFALHMSGRRDTAEEVTQDVFLALLTGLRGYVRERGALQPYLIGMARNQVRRYLTAASRNLRESLEDADEPQGNNANSLFDEISGHEELKAVRSAILNLPPKYREVVVLCDLEGIDYAQAAAELGCAVGTVRSRLHRARALLEGRLKKPERCSA